MTAVFTSSGLGLFNSSADLLGQAGLLGNAGLGQSGEQVYVNAATGNLVIRRIDELLVGQGIDASLTRTYNSHGGMTDGNLQSAFAGRGSCHRVSSEFAS